MKKPGLSLLTLAAAALLSLAATRPACALEFTTEISNASGKTANVDVHAKVTGGTAVLYATYSIPDKSSRTATFLGLTNTCFSFLKGTVGDQPIVTMTCTGVETSPTWAGLGLLQCCGNYKFKVVKAADGTYHFQKTQ